MRENEDYPRRLSDPAAEGIPEYADDDSTAYDDVESGREADGRDPASLPEDRDEGPAVLDDFGTTAEEQLQGESLDWRLTREEPDVSLDELPFEGDEGLADEATSEEAVAEVGLDADVLDDENLNDPFLDSPVSTFERLGADPQTGGRVGRLVAPDDGGLFDDEADSIASDTGAGGGGAGAEETAIHEVWPEE